MPRILQRFLNDDGGLVVSAEIVLITTVLVIGAISGLSAMSNAINSELNPVAAACYNSYQNGSTYGSANDPNYGDPNAVDPAYGNAPYRDNQLAGYDSMNTDEQL